MEELGFGSFPKVDLRGMSLGGASISDWVPMLLKWILIRGQTASTLVLWGVVDFLHTYVHHGSQHVLPGYLFTCCLLQEFIGGLHNKFPLMQIVIVDLHPFLDRRLTHQSEPYVCKLAKKFNLALRELLCEYVNFVSVMQLCEGSQFVHNLCDEYQIQKCATGVHLTRYMKHRVCTKLCDLMV